MTTSTTPPTNSPLTALVDHLTVDEKVALVSGYGLWRTTPIPRLGIPSIVMADGPNGLRYSREQADESPTTGGDFSDFIGLVTRRGAAAPAARPPAPATCFPTASSVGTTWDPSLARHLGNAFARECRSFGVSVLLGPGMNIRRTPLAGRSSEYYSEDPMVTGVMAAALVTGLQEEGIGACAKHFAANNSEIERTSMDSVVDERALRDVYLRAFEHVVREAAPWALMSSYNKLNGTQASASGWLLDTVLRQGWNYEGTVISDWHGITDRPASLRAGGDLDMPQSKQRATRLRHAVAAGDVSAAELDRAASRVLTLVERALAGERPVEPFDADAHHELAREIAREGSVLLVNDGVLPLAPQSDASLLVLGVGAVEPVIQGFGSARMTPTHVDSPLEQIAQRHGRSVPHLRGVTTDPDARATALADAVEAASRADVVIVFAHTNQNTDGENADRPHLSLADGYDELISAVAAVAPSTVVVLTIPDAVEMPWVDKVSAVLVPFYAGQGMGAAVASLLFGESSPSGKLTTTFPHRLEDLPSFLGYPGEAGHHVYVEGPFVGYRGYDIRNITPLFPFGFGLSYTTFDISDAAVSRSHAAAGETVTVSARVTNTGTQAGAEVIQVYASAEAPRLRTAPNELVAFAKVHLAPGEQAVVEMPVRVDDLSHWDTRRGRRVLDDGSIRLRIGTSSREFTAEVGLAVTESTPRWRPLRRDTETSFVLRNPHARTAVSGLLAEHMNVDASTADEMLQQCAKSFVNVFDTLANRFQLVLDEDEIARLIHDVEQKEIATDALSAG
jgi:beta-glucosidase